MPIARRGIVARSLAEGDAMRQAFVRCLCHRAAAWLLVALAGSAAAEGGPGMPTSVCASETCNERQRQIWSRFQHAGSPLRSPARRVFAGSCFANSDLMSRDAEHFVGFVIDDQGTYATLHLRFSFHAPSQPFATLDAREARTRLAGPALPLAFHDGYAYADYQGEQFFSRYWLRRDDGTGNLLMIVYFGFRTTLLCESAPTTRD